MTSGTFIDNLTKIADGIQAARQIVTPDNLDKLENLIPKIRAIVTPGPDGKTTVDQTLDIIAALQNHPVIVEFVVDHLK